MRRPRYKLPKWLEAIGLIVFAIVVTLVAATATAALIDLVT